VALGFPTLIGTSRKSTIGKLTGRGVDAREFGTAATVALAIAVGIDIVRVHDVPEQRDVVRVTDAIVRGWRPDGWTERLP
jgi:dihydropteroate synthase